MLVTEAGVNPKVSAVIDFAARASEASEDYTALVKKAPALPASADIVLSGDYESTSCATSLTTFPQTKRVFLTLFCLRNGGPPRTQTLCTRLSCLCRTGRAGRAMSNLGQLIRCESVALIAVAALLCGAADAQEMFTFLRPPQMQAAPQAIESASVQLDAVQSDVDDENSQLLPPLQRQVVDYQTREVPGTIIVDTKHTFLYFVLGNGKAIRYGIGVGREGFTWSGVKQVIRKAEWPDWYPPPEMLQRQPYLPRMIAGGPGNPLGARAIYIGGTEYRIHGTNDPTTIGKHVSSGCIRMTNDNATDLYNRVKIGTKVIVLPQVGALGQADGTGSVQKTARTTGPNANRTHGLY